MNQPLQDKSLKNASDENARCGFVALLGLPNAGKSTLLNAFVGQAVSITSPKPQTTRFPVRGIGLSGDAQVIVVDTPGLLGKPKTVLDRSMLRSATAELSQVDQVLLVVDVTKSDPWPAIQKRLGADLPPTIWVAFNKIDLIQKPKLLEWAARYKDRAARIFMVSAKKQDGTDDIWKALGDAMPKGPWMYDAETLTTLPQRVWAAEVTRQVLLESLKEEVPHHLYVETERFEKGARRALIIGQVIHVSAAGHKKIVLGKKGQRLKEIGTRARLLLSQRFHKKVHLYLFVRVTENWMDKSDFYRMAGLEKHNG